MNTNYRFSLKKIEESFRASDHKSKTTKYVTLYKSIKRLIISGELPFNWLLPSTRVLSANLNISRTTVNKAYELLQLEKLIDSKIGSGFKVNFSPSSDNSDALLPVIKDLGSYPQISEKGLAFTENISLVNKINDHHLAFRPGLPPLDVFPVNRWKNLLNNYWRYIKSSNLSYSSATGLEELKKSVVNYLNVSRNIKCSHQQIVIVSGSLQSLYLVATALINKGDTVVLENPVFPNVHSVFKSSQAKIKTCSMDSEGIAISNLKLNRSTPKVIHVTPSNQYPLGIKMSLERRLELLVWASNKKAVIIENDYENEIANNQMSLPSIFSLDKEDRTIYMGTFNRLLHPSIRLGYMIVPRYLVKTIKALQEHSHRFVPPSIQVVMNQFIEKNYLYQHIKSSIDVAKERYEIFKSEFEKVSTKMRLEDHNGTSFHVIAKFNEDFSTRLEESKTIKRLEERGITAHSLSKCYINAPKTYGLVFGYAAVRPRKLIQKIQSMKGKL
ncbi:PLP-dependent aminotransferase family protein [Winogradskyella sp.]|uniref:MocR-like pyridoxine biosynthesis transcription factor PdxR n=1 Tax=Winogradskyella sp. TaxID=1883156 RepID=UPI0026290161|nr:PLP-dependent aminotransferase family protein [Winogradskyella sp.]